MRARQHSAAFLQAAPPPRAGERVARALVNGASRLFGAVVFVALFAMLIIGLYAIWDANAVYRAADATRWQAYVPEKDDHGSYDELVAINPDVVGWLDIYGTHISYPLVQGSNDSEYLNKDASGSYSLSGSIFLDARNAADFTDFNTIIYGHHMDHDAMFGEIGNFADAEYFNAREYGSLYVGKGPDAGTTFGLRIVAFIHADAYDGTIYRPGVEGAAEQQAYLAHLLAQATNKRALDAGVAGGERIVLLSTCSDASTNARSIVVAAVERTVHANTFAEPVELGAGVDIPEGWLDFPWLGWAALLALLALLLGLMLRRLAARRQRRARMASRTRASGRHMAHGGEAETRND